MQQQLMSAGRSGVDVGSVRNSLSATSSLAHSATASATQASRLTKQFANSLATSGGGGGFLGSAANDSDAVQLSQEDVKAIEFYSGDGFKFLNEMLRGKYPYEEMLAHQSDALSVALSHAPQYQGIVLRGTDLSVSELERYKVGNTVREKAFTSCDKDKPHAGPTQFEIMSYSGRDISRWSINSVLIGGHENEVLFDKGAKFKVLDRYKSDDNVTHIIMKEVES